MLPNSPYLSKEKRAEAEVRAKRRYCQDCRFFEVEAGKSKEFGRCGAPGAEPVGVERFIAPEFTVMPYASTMRSLDKDCGNDGKWFEPQEPTTGILSSIGGRTA